MALKKHLPGIIFLFHILALLSYHKFGYLGHFGYDDLHYAQLADDFNHGKFNFGDHYSYRFPIVILTAISYRIFGISDFSSSLPPLIFTILTLWLVFILLKKKPIITIFTGLSFTLFSSWFIFYADKLMPDIYLAFAVMLALFIIHQHKFGTLKNVWLSSALLSLSLLFGFMAKETIILILPLLIYFAVTDFIMNRNRKFWMISAITGAIMLLAYFIIIGILSGDFTKRFEAVIQNSYLNLCSYDKQPLRMVLERIGYQFFAMLIFQGMFAGVLMLLVQIFQLKPKSWLFFDDSQSFWLVSSVVLLLSSNFMSISVSAYSPMCLDPRHYLFLVPVLAIPASMLLPGFFEKRKQKILLTLFFGSTTLISFLLPGDSAWYHYLPLTIIFGVSVFLGNNKLKLNLVLAAVLVILTIIPLKSVIHARRINYNAQKEKMISEVIEKHPDKVVITDEVGKRLGNYFNKFNKKYKSRFLSFNDLKDNPDSTYENLLVLNWYTQYLSGMNNDDLPYYAKNVSPDNLIFEDKELNLAVYRLQTGQNSEKELFKSVNDFETMPAFWDLNGNEITGKKYFEGRNSLLLSEFSAVFSYSMDTIQPDKMNNILVSSTVACNFDKPTKANLVFSIENTEGSYFWKGEPVDRFKKAYGNWWQAKLETSIPVSEIKPGSKLKVYVWNIDKQEGYIDNFEIIISEIKSSN